MRTNCLSSWCIPAIFCFLIFQFGKGQAIVQFNADAYTLIAGQGTSVCVNVVNGNFTEGGYDIAIEFNGSSLPHFPGEGYRRIQLRSKDYCFPLESMRPLLQVAQSDYSISILSLDPNLEVSDAHGDALIHVLNHAEPVFLGHKELLFIGYDNEITTYGTDDVALLTISPITRGTRFSLTNAVPYDKCGRLFIPYNDSLISSYLIEYAGNETILPFSKIGFKIIRMFNGDESLSNFTINDVASTNFSISNNGATAMQRLNLSKTSPS